MIPDVFYTSPGTGWRVSSGEVTYVNSGQLYSVELARFGSFVDESTVFAELNEVARQMDGDIVNVTLKIDRGYRMQNYLGSFRPIYSASMGVLVSASLDILVPDQTPADRLRDAVAKVRGIEGS